MIRIHPHDKLGALAAQVPAASRVFMRHRLDFCCGGAQTLAEACAKASVDADAVIAEIDAELARGRVEDERWDERPLDDLVDHILARYHAPLRPELDRLVEMSAKVARVHGEKDPERLSRLAAVVVELREDLLAHMAKEEAILFPWIRSGDGSTAAAPVRVMLAEHEACARLLEELFMLTDGFRPPRGACRTWQALYLSLEELDAALKQHMHLENNVLFPRALSS